MVCVFAVFRVVVRVVSVDVPVVHWVAVHADVYCSVLHDKLLLGRVVEGLISSKEVHITKPHNPPETFG